MNSNISLSTDQLRSLGKRKRGDAATITSGQLLTPLFGALKELSLTIEGSTVADDRIHFDQDFTKKLVADCLGLPSRLKTPLSFAILYPGGCPLESSRSAKLKFSSGHKSYLKLGSNTVNQLNLSPGDVLKLEYRFWQRGGGGKDGFDPVYYFSLDSAKPSAGFTKQQPKSRNLLQLEASDALTVLSKATDTQTTLFKTSPSTSIPPRYPAPKKPNGTRNLNSLTSYHSTINTEIETLTQPVPGLSLVQTYRLTAGFTSIRLHVRSGFLKSLLESTMGITCSQNLKPLKLRILLENGAESVFEDSILNLKFAYFSRWSIMIKKLGGAVLGDDLVLTYMGNSSNITGETVYYFNAKINHNSCSSDDEEEEEDVVVNRLGATDPVIEDDDDEKNGDDVYSQGGSESESMGNLLQKLEEWNKKYETSPTTLPIASNKVERNEEKKLNPRLAVESPKPPQRRPDAPEPLKDRSMLSIQEIHRFKADSRSNSPFLAPIEPEKTAECEDNDFQLPAQPPQKSNMILDPVPKLPDLRTGLVQEHIIPSILQACADEINILEYYMRQIAAQGHQNPTAASAAQNSKDTALINSHRYRLAKHFLDGGIAREILGINSARNVFIDSNGTSLSSFSYRENSRWCGDYVGNLKDPLFKTLIEHGAYISSSLETVLRGQWPFPVWAGNMNSTELLPAGVGVVALSDIPAGSFVCQFFGEYISWDELPGLIDDIFDSYCDEEDFLRNLMKTKGCNEAKEVDAGNESGAGEVLVSSDDETEKVQSVWLGNISTQCTKYDLYQTFASYGEVESVKLIQRKGYCPFAFINFKTASSGVAAIKNLSNVVIPSVTGQMPLVIRFQKAKEGSRRGTGAGASADDEILNDDEFYYRHRHSELTKRYRSHIAQGTECLACTNAAKTPLQRKVIQKAPQPRGANASMNNSQWRRLNTTVIDAKYLGNATRFMRPSEVNFNLARVQLNVPNGPTKILYYAIRNIAKGEELVRQP